ncbi:hypothetical protein DL239_20930 [Sedimentitalea sp. CY04]|uniref:HTH luxR-type domain-containing protein n=1 Tax=Parasedimentitalea denitrificans TaxID=2211118 RepID=A0ABX0WFH5_9RHOB|nr:hypothetical protein [Sedimentitalea sp. CY04]NIZ63432.1 hypothetical protein [Sedimentitalea sp. CY04]
MQKSRPTFLSSLFILQAICSFFFIGDIIQDMGGQPEVAGAFSEVLEAGVAICLLVGTLFAGWELRKTLQREERMQQQLSVASGAFAEIMQTQFETWGLSEAERSVALLGIKGYSISEIADLRATKEGTIKAQNAAVYRKAGVSGRLQLLSHFVEDLLDDRLISPVDTK